MSKEAGARRAALEAYYHDIIGNVSDLEAFALVTEHAAETAQGDYDAFVLDVSRLTLGARSNWAAIVSGFFDRAWMYAARRMGWKVESAANRFGSSGFAADDGSNQVQHFWYFAAVAYTWGPRIADLLARYHEWNAPGILRRLPASGMGHGTELDLALSRKSIALGRALAKRRIAPERVGAWVRRELGTRERAASHEGEAAR
ncbi:MAG TPA: hypothetical protein VFR15_15720 [Chloroflexia bacterium]|nr:hypothetical protein [Chloroflexia bacterium]